MFRQILFGFVPENFYYDRSYLPRCSEVFDWLLRGEINLAVAVKGRTDVVRIS